jgi:hypothetical protein
MTSVFNSRESLSAAIKNVESAKLNVVSTEIGTPSPFEAELFLSKGSFASPQFAGFGTEPAARIIAALQSYFGNPIPVFSEEVKRMAAAFDHRHKTIQVLGQTIDDPHGGYCRETEVMHRDFDPASPTHPLVRLVRAYVGAGTVFKICGEETEYQTPPNCALVFRGGKNDGLVHRSPPIGNGRVIVIMSHAIIPSQNFNSVKPISSGCK